MGGAKFYSSWQPLRGTLEDNQTALVFGFLRHAPVEYALRPWLADLLSAPQLSVAPLAVDSFWPDYPSQIDGHHWTQPELTFEVDDGGPVCVVVENKISDGDHTFEQISREIVDVAAAKRPKRLALVMVGPDLGVPYPLRAWERDIKQLLRQDRLGRTQARLYYSPWRDIGRHLRQISHGSGELATYAADVVQQLKRSGQMGYEGAPVLDDLTMDITGAITAYNRIVLAGRQLFRDLTTQSRFLRLALNPWRGTSYQLVTDNASRALGQPEEYFEFSTMACCFRSDKWRNRQGVFAAIAINPDGAELCGGAYVSLVNEVTWSFANSDEVSVADAHDAYLASKRASLLPYVVGTSNTTFRYASRPWMTTGSDTDVLWLLDVLTQAVAIQNAYPAGRAGRTVRR